MTKEGTPTAWHLVAANEGQGQLPPAAADDYWQDISLQASARLARLEEKRKHAVEDEIRQSPGGGRFASRTRRLLLMVGVGVILLTAVGWLLLEALPTLALPP